MTVWQWLYRAGPGWPRLKERQIVSLGVFGLVVMMLWMAKTDPALWEIELFKLLLTTFAVTGLVNMVLGFHYSANKQNEQATENTGKAFDAIAATATGTSAGGDVIRPGDEVTIQKETTHEEDPPRI